MLPRAQHFIRRAGKKLGLADTDIDALLKPDAEHKFEIELGGQKLPAYRVQHSNKRGPYKGGIRFHKDVNLDEVRALATLMSLKTAAAGLPLGGGKGGVAVDPRQLSDEELESLSRKYVAELHPHIGPDKDIPAPDVNTNARIIDWMVDEYARQTGEEAKASFTGKSLPNGGSRGRDAATGRGGVMALAELLKQTGRAGEPLTYAVQGYGNVGAFFATVAAQEHPEWKLVAASDSQSAVYNPDGLDAQKLADFKAEKGRFNDVKEGVADHLSNDELLMLDVDVLVLAALENAVTENNANQIRARYIIEMGNGPVDEAAHDILTGKGVVILPDIIANSGGVVVSYLEWLQNKQAEQWTEARVNEELASHMVRAVDDTLAAAKKYNLASLTEAAFIVALQRLTKGEDTRG